MKKRFIKYDKALIESNQKDILIAQLQAENLELRMRLYSENSNDMKIKDLEQKIIDINKNKSNAENLLSEDKASMESKLNSLISEISNLKLSMNNEKEKLKCLSEENK